MGYVSCAQSCKCFCNIDDADKQFSEIGKNLTMSMKKHEVLSRKSLKTCVIILCPSFQRLHMKNKVGGS